MSRYRGPKVRIVRRLGKLPGLTRKRSKKSKSKPGQHGSSENKKKRTDFGIRLEEKQKLKFNYGLSEKQLYLYIKEARKRKGITSLILFQLLEMRIDTICYNVGFASTIAQARQLVNHGHIVINNKTITIPSFQCQLGDIIGIKPKSNNYIRKNLKRSARRRLPSNLIVSFKKLKVKVRDYCRRDEIALKLEELLVIEYYSRR